jgi:hypothetical protein
MSGPAFAEKDVERFWSKVNRTTGCWLWAGETNNQGYGRFTTWSGNTRIRTLAHRWVMGVELGRQLDRWEIVLHTCDTPRCVNPQHLRVGTQADNVRDALSKGRLNTSGLWRSGPRKTHCKRGHPLAGRNLLYTGNERRCRACNEIHQAAYRGRRQTRGPKPHREDHPALCWCKAELVAVSPAETQALLTRSCGLPRCDEADRAARAER